MQSYIVSRFADGRRGERDAGSVQINGHTLTAVCNATMINVLCAVINWSMVNMMRAGSRDNGAVSCRLVPSCETHFIVFLPKGVPTIWHQLPASRQASKG